MEKVELLREIVCEVNAWNGGLDYLEYHDFDEEFFNTFFCGNPMEASRATYFGNICWNDEYIKFDAYGNLESASEHDVERELLCYEDEIIQTALECIDDITLSDEAMELVSEYNESE